MIAGRKWPFDPKIRPSEARAGIHKIRSTMGPALEHLKELKFNIIFFANVA
jgi:hypothetical protein